MSKFALNLKFARMRKGLTQLAVARALGVREDVITYLETDRRTPTPELRAKLERLLGPIGGENAEE